MSRGREIKGLLRSLPDTFVIKIREAVDEFKNQPTDEEVAKSKDLKTVLPTDAQLVQSEAESLRFKRISSSFTHRIISIKIAHGDVNSLNDELLITLAPADEPVTFEERMIDKTKEGTINRLPTLAKFLHLKNFMPKKRDALEISFGYSVNTLAAYHRLSMHIGMIKMGVFYVNEINYSKDDVLIKATSCLDDNSNKVHFSNLWTHPLKPKQMIDRSNPDNKYTYNEMIIDISKSLNLKGDPYIEKELKDQHVKVIQEDRSGIDFLANEAKKEDVIFKIKNDRIYFVNKWNMPINDSSLNSHPPPVGKVNNTIQLYRGDFITYELIDTSRSDYLTVKACWRDYEAGESDTNVFYTIERPKQRSDGSLQWYAVFQITELFSSEEKAILAAHQKLNEFVDRTDTFKGTILLEPQLVVGCQIKLQSFVKIRGDKKIADKLNVTSVTHEFSSRGFITTFEASVPTICKKYYCLGSRPKEVKPLTEKEKAREAALRITLN